MNLVRSIFDSLPGFRAFCCLNSAGSRHQIVDGESARVDDCSHTAQHRFGDGLSDTPTVETNESFGNCLQVMVGGKLSKFGESLGHLSKCVPEYGGDAGSVWGRHMDSDVGSGQEGRIDRAGEIASGDEKNVRQSLRIRVNGG